MTPSHFRCWHLADVQTALMNVRVEGNNGHDAEVARCLLMAARRLSIAATPIHEAVFANLGGRGQPVRAQVDLTGANEERKDSDKKIPCTVIVKPPLPRLETGDNRMTSSCVMF
jgi:hypothetical protein